MQTQYCSSIIPIVCLVSGIFSRMSFCLCLFFLVWMKLTVCNFSLCCGWDITESMSVYYQSLHLSCNVQIRHAYKDNRKWSNINIRTLSHLFQEPNLTVDYNLTISRSYRPVHPEKLKQESIQLFKWTKDKIHHIIFPVLHSVQSQNQPHLAIAIFPLQKCWSAIWLRQLNFLLQTRDIISK